MKMAEKRFAVSKLIASTRNMLNASMDVESIKRYLNQKRFYHCFDLQIF